MKLFRKNSFANWMAKIVEKGRGIYLTTKLGNVQSYVRRQEQSTIGGAQPTVAKKTASIYSLYVHSAHQHDEIIDLINEGYTVIANTELLSDKGKKVLEVNLKRVLAQYGLSYHSVSSNSFMVAPSSVKVINNAENPNAQLVK